MYENPFNFQSSLEIYPPGHSTALLSTSEWRRTKPKVAPTPSRAQGAPFTLPQVTLQAKCIPSASPFHSWQHPRTSQSCILVATMASNARWSSFCLRIQVSWPRALSPLHHSPELVTCSPPRAAVPASRAASLPPWCSRDRCRRRRALLAPHPSWELADVLWNCGRVLPYLSRGSEQSLFNKTHFSPESILFLYSHALDSSFLKDPLSSTLTK